MKDFKEILSESKVFPKDIITKMAKMTDWNDHTGARVLLAKTIKHKKMLAAYEGLDAVSDYFGESPKEMIDLRRMIDKKLFDYVNRNFSNAHDVDMAF